MKLSQLMTERRNPATENLDSMSALEIVSVMNREDTVVPRRIRRVLPQIAQAVDLIAVGFAIAARSPWIWLVLLVFFVAVYVPVIRSEEAFLRSKFPDFELYARQVPRILPRWSGESVTSQFSRELYLKHREYNALIGAAMIMLAIAVKMLMVRNA